VLQALRDERELDQRLARNDAALPADLLRELTAPAPSAGFVDVTMQRIQADRRHRWQALLARYVAPEPSPEFVSRTLRALARDDHGDPHDADPRGTSPQAQPAPARPAGWRNRTLFALAAAAAALLAWLFSTPEARPPLERRLADRATAAAAHREATSPLAAMMAQIEHEAEPFALVDETADGIWLVRASGGRR
jgi:hypothetical protein